MMMMMIMMAIVNTWPTNPPGQWTHFQRTWPLTSGRPPGESGGSSSWLESDWSTAAASVLPRSRTSGIGELALTSTDPNSFHPTRFTSILRRNLSRLVSASMDRLILWFCCRDVIMTTETVDDCSHELLPIATNISVSSMKFKWKNTAYHNEPAS